MSRTSSPDHAQTLPPIEEGPAGRIHVFKRYDFITLQFRERDGAPGHAYTLHEVEARKLASLLEAASAAPAIESDQAQSFSFTEGVCRGGPPTGAQRVRARAHPPADPLGEQGLWDVWRQDDNGNRFLISSDHSRERAEQLAAEFEQRGHRQMYWVAPKRLGA